MSIYVPTYVKDAVDRGIGEVTRRVEVYESNAKDLWRDGLVDRLVDGTVNISYGDNERRTLDITLSNVDNMLRSTPDGFWYDKVFKLYRGLKFPASQVNPSVAVIEAISSIEGNRLVAWMQRLGFRNAVYVTVPSYTNLANYDVIVSASYNTATAYGPLLQQLFAEGRSIITYSNRNTSAEVPHLGNTTTKTSTWGISQPNPQSFLSPGWTGSAASATSTGTGVTSLASGALLVARWTMSDSSTSITASVTTNTKGARWADMHLPNYFQGTNPNINGLMSNIISWIRNSTSNTVWESQLGEFVIDGITGDNFPSQVKVTGRDYTKKCLNSKIESAMTFDANTNVGVLITALGANAGITKFRLASMPETIATAMSFDRGTARWEVMQQAAKTQGYEMYFDREGYLTTRKYLDPTLSQEDHIFKTGTSGNLAKITRSVNDSRIYNHISVYGDPPSGESRFPYYGEARNTNPSSPTRIDKLGDRYFSFASTFFTSDAQCQEYADRLLTYHALESFELSFSAIAYPWMEVGEIAKVIDPEAVSTDPDKYLLDSGAIPLALGPMSFTGKRITIVR